MKIVTKLAGFIDCHLSKSVLNDGDDVLFINLNGYYQWRNIGGYYNSWNSDNPIGVYYYDMLNKLRNLI